MKLVTVNWKNETAVCEISNYEEDNPHVGEPSLWCYPLDSNERPFSIFFNNKKYIAIDDVVFRDSTWIKNFFYPAEKDQLSLAELSKIYFKISGKRYINLKRLRYDVIHSFPSSLFFDGLYLYKEESKRYNNNIRKGNTFRIF